MIKEDIQALNVALVDLQNLSAASRVTNKQSSSHSHTVVDNLRLRLKDTTKEFQNVLQVRKENLEKNKARQQQFSSAPDRSTFDTARPGVTLRWSHSTVVEDIVHYSHVLPRRPVAFLTTHHACRASRPGRLFLANKCEWPSQRRIQSSGILPAPLWGRLANNTSAGLME